MRKPFAGGRRLAYLTAAAGMVLGSAVVQVTTAGPAAAVPGLQTVVARSPSQSFTGWTQDASCPADRQVIGGGGLIGGNASNKVFLTESYPVDGRTWRVRAAEVAPGWNGTWDVTAYAICS